MSRSAEDHAFRQVTSVDGTPIGYLQGGTGPPLLLVHGAIADHRRWAAVLPRLEPHFTVYVMDRRGRGVSGDSAAYDLLREAEDIAAVAGAIGQPASVLGHSHGALCSLEAALLTDQISRLVLYEPPIPGVAPVLPPGTLDLLQELVHSGRLEAALEFFLREVVRMPEDELAAYRQLPMWQARIALVPTLARELGTARTYAFVAERFAGLQAPTGLLLGGDSPPFARQAVEMVDAALPNSTVVVLPGQQHIAMDTAPDLFTREVVQFLRA